MGILCSVTAGSERAIVSWHAHVYFDPASTRPQAARVRAGIAERFKVQLGRWHDVPIGPHSAAMYQVAFDVEVFADLVPWLALHREELSVLVHPNTLAPRADHLLHALWLGPPLPLRGDVLPERIEASEESPVVPNT
jgi:aromatic ring-cleaving dioxygenase